MSEDSPLGKYRLCPNSTVKFAFFIGIALQVATLCLGIAMLSLGGWVTVTKSAASVASNRFSLTRVEGLLQDCYPATKPDFFEPQTSSSCYTKDFGQYSNSDSSLHQIRITTAGAALASLGLLTCLLDLIIGLHLAFIWCRAPYDSFFMRAYRLFVGFCSTVTSCLFFATLVVYHVGLRLSIQRGPWNTLEHTSIALNNGYYVAWACVATSVLAAWVTVSSTCFWAVDYVNCRSVAAAFHPTCSHRASALTMANGIRSSIYSLNTDGVWSIQDPPTLPRYYTSTFGDGSELRNKAAEASTGENEESKKETGK